MSKKIQHEELETVATLADDLDQHSRSEGERSAEDVEYESADSVTPEQTAAAVERSLARTGDFEGSATHAAAYRPDVDWPDSSGRELDRLSFHPEVAGETPNEQKAWAKVSDAAAKLAEARLAITLLEADQRDEQRDHDAKAAAAMRSSKPSPKLTVTDWASESRQRRARALIAGEDVRAARASYDAVAKAEAPKRLDAAVTAMRDAKDRADALCPEALAAFEAWRAAVSTVEAVAGAADENVARWAGSAGMAPDVQATVRAATAGVGALRSVLGSEHPAVTGEYAAGQCREMNPPLHARENIYRHGRESEVVYLASVEVSERWSKTSLLQEYALQMRMVPAELLGQ